jgi:DNA-directed RNA polymerase subunit beta'
MSEDNLSLKNKKDSQHMFDNFDAIAISIASPDVIRSWSSGEIRRPETINYRTGKPEKDGLFCARIFGPVRDYECICGKYKRQKHKGVVCEKCGVEVTLCKVRRFRMGHIDLAAPVAHIWFTKAIPSRVAMILGMTMKDVDSILYFEKYIVVDPGTTQFEKNQLITEKEYDIACEECAETGDEFVAMIGAEGIKKVLENMDLEQEKAFLMKEIEEAGSEIKKKRSIKRLKLILDFIKSGNRPEWMIIDVLPVLPPDLRPLVPLEGGRFAVSDLNDLYRRVINRNNRLRRLLELRAPDIIVRNEKRMLQESVDALFDNSRRSRPILGMNKRPLKSLSDAFRGKQGRFRQNLLGKRVDYSGRSVIVVGPDLKLHQCGLPKEMALELFRPFIFGALQKHGHAQTLHAAKKMVEVQAPEVWDVLEEVVKDHPVLLNRAPTLHRQSIQAFEPVLVNGRAIQLHPLVCSVFNADFDGDQMAVHIPLSIEAQIEAKVLMLSAKNIRSPANGSFSIIPTKDMILGLYYLTFMKPVEDKMKIFASIFEVFAAEREKIISLHNPIYLRVKVGNKFEKIETTAGRCVLHHAIVDTLGEKYKENISFTDTNVLLSSKTVKEFFALLSKRIPDSEIVKVADALKDLGFKYATYSGISFGLNDLVAPEDKYEVIEKYKEMVDKYQNQFDSGLITESERYNKVINAWSECTQKLSDALVELINEKDHGFGNDINVISSSGARGSKEQIRQLCAMRGMMTDTKGDVLEVPITRSFKEGLEVIQYIISTYGGRKGLADTAFKTADSGYLTRRLVDVSQDSIIKSVDCGCSTGISVRSVRRGGDVIVSLKDGIFGRFASEDIFAHDGSLICKRNDFIDEAIADRIVESNIDVVKVRSPLTCESTKGNVCRMCYGFDFAKSHIVNMYESVGIIAAQSISEPGTQLTMRTFHSGGLAQTDHGDSAVTAPFDGVVKLENMKLINYEGSTINIARSAEIIILDHAGKEAARYRVPYGAAILTQNMSSVKGDDVLARWDPYSTPIVSDKAGKVIFKDLIDGVSAKEKIDELTGISVLSILDWKRNARGDKIYPRIIVETEDGSELLYNLYPGTVLQVVDGENVSPGQLIARLPKEVVKSKDITGGLQRVSELFEVKKQKDIGVMVVRSGTFHIDIDGKSANSVYVLTENGSKDVYSIPRNRTILVQNGDKVRAGELLTDGEASLHDILAILGIEKFANYLINEIQDIYRMHGIKINDKHFEVVIRQMLMRVKITSTGESHCGIGDVLNVYDFERLVKKLESEGKIPPKGVRLLEGITKASLASRSYMSAASFRASTSVIAEAAVAGMRDSLSTNKAALIAGKLIEAGTGGVVKHRLHHHVASNDNAELHN